MLARAFLAGVLIAALFACTAEPALEEASEPELPPQAATLQPDSAPPRDVEVMAVGVPPAEEEDGSEYDYPGAALAVLNLYAALLDDWHSQRDDASAADWTVSDSQARAHVEDLLDELRATGAEPVGLYVLRDFEMGGFTPELLQVDFCLDQSDTRLGSSEEGGSPASLAGSTGSTGSAAEVLWVGFGMEREADGAWRAFSISHREVAEDTEHLCG